MAAALPFLLGIIGVLAGVAAALLGIGWMEGRLRARPRGDGPETVFDVAPPEPGWIEVVGEEAGLTCSRGHSFHPELMRQDARGDRGEFTLHGDG